MIASLRRVLLASSVLAVTAAAPLVVTAPSSAGAVTGSAARNCSPPKYPGLGYFTSLKVSHTSCASGSSFVKAYYRCRVARGGRDGRCVKRVQGYKCREVRERIPTQIDARVTCSRGSRRIVHTYQQDI